MKIDRIAVTGADDTIHPSELIRLTEKFPQVEWGILLSATSAGRDRFPSFAWMQALKPIAQAQQMKLAGHLCGKWVRHLVESANFTFKLEHPNLYEMFQRIQINFHSQRHTASLGFVKVLQDCPGRQFIFQMDGTENNHHVLSAIDSGVDAVPLFDTSGGIGVLPDVWPNVWPSLYCGYAGGLGPHNLERQLAEIEKVVGDATIWIDMETHVRTGPNFDLGKVEQCLEIASRWQGGQSVECSPSVGEVPADDQSP